MKPRIAIIAAEFNPGIVDPMVQAAQDELQVRGATVSNIVRVPGVMKFSCCRFIAQEG